MDFPRIENALEVCEKHLNATASWGTEIESYLARYMLTVIYSSYEEWIKEIFVKRCSNSTDKHLSEFVKSAVNQLFRGIRINQITGILGSFGDDYKMVFTDKIQNTEAHNAYDALINNRQDTAHREGANVTFSDIKRFYKDSKPVLETIEEILGSNKIT